MKIQQLLKGCERCACGRQHTCDIHHIVIGENALEWLPEICAPFSRILLVSDGNTYPLCGDRVKALLGEKISYEHRFGTSVVVPNESAIKQIEAAVEKGTDLLLGIGSGVINDLCKYVSHQKGLRYCIIATAPSMDGYASVGAALILEQRKVTINARVPYAIIAEGDVLRSAPTELIQSGYGDIVGKYSCLCDWRLAKHLRGEYFCEFVWRTVLDTVRKTEGQASALLDREPRAINALMEALVLVGVMMSYVGNSRPASGSEHHLSHFFEITGLLNGTPYYPHGIDVLCSAAVTAELRERLLAMKPPFAPYVHDRDRYERKIREIYGSAAAGIIALQQETGLYQSLDTEILAEKWETVQAILSEAPDYKAMVTYVNAIGLDMERFRSFYGKQTIENAICYAKDLKDRYTVLWLFYALGLSLHQAK